MSANAEQQAGAAQELKDAPAASPLAMAMKATRVSDRDSVKSSLEVLIGEIAKSGGSLVDKDPIRTINRIIQSLDERLTLQTREILHHPKFTKLEGSWRGLFHLVDKTETAADLKIKLMQCSKSELQKDLTRAIEFDQSMTFQKIYRDEFGMAGGEPFAAIVGDYAIENNEDDLSMLSSMSQVSAAGFCPFLTSPAPSLFQMDGWTELMAPRDLELTFQGPKYVKWNAFRDSEDSRFVAMAMPRALARTPYGSGGKKIDEFNFEEVDLSADGTPVSADHDQFCWMNAAYVLATRLTNAYSKTGFDTSVLGVDSGGRVEDLPVFAFRTDDGVIRQKCPTEINIDDRRANELAKLGFMGLVHWKNKDYAAFLTGDTVQRPKKYAEPQANENAQASAWLPYILASGRFAHYVKCIGRNMLGSQKEAEDVERELTNWLNLNFVLLNDKPTEDQKKEKPLREARVEVRPVPGKAGAFDAKLFLRPWTFVRELTAAMSMVTNIPTPKS